MNSMTKTKQPSMGLRPIADRVWIRLAPVLLAASAIIAGGTASAGEMISQFTRTTTSDLTDGYSNCAFGPPLGFAPEFSSRYQTTMRFKSAQGHLGSLYPNFRSRGIVIYLYDEDGKLLPGDPVLPYLYYPAIGDLAIGTLGGLLLPGPKSGRVFYPFGSHTTQRPGSPWRETGSVSALVFAYTGFLGTQHPGSIAAPAMALRAANITESSTWSVTDGELILDDKMAYIRQGDPPGVCHTIQDPANPPPLEAQIQMNAPDWNLGELQQGEKTVKPFPATPDQLCFTSNRPTLAGSSYVINATNQNGLASNGWYRLQHQSSPADTVPYRVVLQNSTTNAEVALPNNGNVAATFANSDRECFIPTFTADTPKTAKEGDYSDVLTFTVVARP